MSTSLATSWLSINDAAKHAGVSPKSIRRAIERGDLHAGRFGRRVLVELQQLDNFLHRGR